MKPGNGIQPGGAPVAGLWRAWRLYLGYYRGDYAILLGCVAASAVQCLLVLPMAFLVRHAFDVLIPEGNVPGLIFMGAGLLLLNLLNSATTLWVRHVTLKTTKDAIRRLREELLLKCYALPRSFHSRVDRARLHAVLVQDTERLDSMSNALVAMFLPALVLSTGLCVVLLVLNPVLFVAMLVVAPPLLLVGQIMKRVMKRRVQAFHCSFEDYSKGMLFVLEMMDLTRMQSAEALEIERQGEHIETVRRDSGAMAWVSTAYTTVQKGISTVAGMLILVVGGIGVVRGDILLGDMLSFYVAAALLNHYVAIMLASVPQIYDGRESLRTLHALATEEEPQPYTGTRRLPSFSGRIALREVHFGYDARPILRGLSLDIAPGRLTVLLGPNGAGKTTLLHLVSGFYRPQAGELTADGEAFETLDLADLRRSMAVVPQDPILFPGTLLENITYGCPAATLEAVREAAALSTADEFIALLPAGYDTPAGENGILLSGGQRQRIALARAFLRKPRLLILDEPTAHLDAPSCDGLLESLEQLDPRPAILCITHDLRLAREADAVYLLQEDGRLAAQETAAALLEAQPLLASTPASDKEAP